MSNVSETAKDAVRQNFNPSGNQDVAEIKAMTAALVAKMEELRDRDGGSKCGREAAVAITNIQTASMWCVLAATKGL